MVDSQNYSRDEVEAYNQVEADSFVECLFDHVPRQKLVLRPLYMKWDQYKIDSHSGSIRHSKVEPVD